MGESAGTRVLAGLGALALTACFPVMAFVAYLGWAYRVGGYSTDTGGDHAAQPFVAWPLAAVSFVALIAVLVSVVHLVRCSARGRGLDPALRAFALALALSFAWVLILVLSPAQECVARCALGGPA